MKYHYFDLENQKWALLLCEESMLVRKIVCAEFEKRDIMRQIFVQIPRTSVPGLHSVKTKECDKFRA